MNIDMTRIIESCKKSDEEKLAEVHRILNDNNVYTSKLLEEVDYKDTTTKQDVIDLQRKLGITHKVLHCPWEKTNEN